MSSNTSSGSNTSSMAVPEAKEAMKRFKEEVASEIGVPLRGLQRRVNQQTGWFYRRRDGQENDHEAGRADVRKIEE